MAFPTHKHTPHSLESPPAALQGCCHGVCAVHHTTQEGAQGVHRRSLPPPLGPNSSALATPRSSSVHCRCPTSAAGCLGVTCMLFGFPPCAARPRHSKTCSKILTRHLKDLDGHMDLHSACCLRRCPPGPTCCCCVSCMQAGPLPLLPPLVSSLYPPHHLPTAAACQHTQRSSRGPHYHTHRHAPRCHPPPTMGSDTHTTPSSSHTS
jgi:hypothetical protein